MAIDAAIEAKAALDSWLKRNLDALAERGPSGSQSPLQQQQQQQSTLVAPQSQSALADARAVEQGFENASAMRAAIDQARQSNTPFRIGNNRYESYSDYLRDQAERLQRAAQRDADRAAAEAERSRRAYLRREAELASIRRGEFGAPGPRLSPAQRAFEQSRRAGAQRIQEALARAADIQAASPGMSAALAAMIAGAEAVASLLVGPAGAAMSMQAPGFSPAESSAQMEPHQPMSGLDAPNQRPEPMTPAMEDLDGIYWQPLTDTLERGALQLAEGYAESLLIGALGVSSGGAAWLPTLVRGGATMFNNAADVYSIARAVVQATDISQDNILQSAPAINLRLPVVPSLVTWLYSSEAVQQMQRQRQIDVRAEVAAAVSSFAYDSSVGKLRTPMSLVTDIATRLIGPPMPGLTEMAARQIADATQNLARSIAFIAGINPDAQPAAAPRP